MSSRLNEVAKKKEDILSKILKVDLKSLKVAKAAKAAKAATTVSAAKRSQSRSSGMDTRIIANIQEKINNPLFNITIADYELMCGNKMITKMMSKVLECDDKQLKKFCKYINVFKENINSSPKSIKNKMKPKMTLNKLPEELRTQIVEQYKHLFPTKYVLRDWIPLENLDWGYLSKNPNAIDMLKMYPNKIDWVWLSSNPNPEAIELLKANLENIDWGFLSMNPNSEAIELLKANPDNINWDMLSGNSNPIAVQLLKENPDEIHWGNLSGNSNPNAIKLLEKRINENNKIDEDEFEDDFDYFDKIDWDKLSANPNAIRLLKANPEKINWEGLSANPNSFELLKKYPEKIVWEDLSLNRNAIKLLKKYPKKINWTSLSSNINAIELLKENQGRINWIDLSANPAIFEAK